MTIKVSTLKEGNCSMGIMLIGLVALVYGVLWYVAIPFILMNVLNYFGLDVSFFISLCITYLTVMFASLFNSNFELGMKK